MSLFALSYRFSRLSSTQTCDRQTDGRTHDDGKYRASIASRGKSRVAQKKRHIGIETINENFDTPKHRCVYPWCSRGCRAPHFCRRTGCDRRASVGRRRIWSALWWRSRHPISTRTVVRQGLAVRTTSWRGTDTCADNRSSWYKHVSVPPIGWRKTEYQSEPPETCNAVSK